MFIMTNAKMKNMEQKRDRYLCAANVNHELAKQFFSVGSRDFALFLKTAYQLYGAAMQIDEELQQYGYKKKAGIFDNYSEHEIELIVSGLRQRTAGLIMVVLGFLTIIPEHDATAAFLVVPLGIYTMLVNKRIL